MKDALQFVESIEMRKYLEQVSDQISLSQWCNLIAKSRIGLTKKITALRELAEKYHSDEGCLPAAMADDAERALHLTKRSASATVFQLRSYWRENQDKLRSLEVDLWNLPTMGATEPYHTFEQAVHVVVQAQEELLWGIDPIDENLGLVDYLWAWNEITRYDLSPEGRLEGTIVYMVGESGIIWGYEWLNGGGNKEKRVGTNYFSLLEDLNLPTPFQQGDIITVDCRPFDKIYHALILENTYPNDCCSLFCVYFDYNLVNIDYGALEHLHRLSFRPTFSPLLRAAVYDGELLEYEAPLKLLSEKTKQNPAFADRICNSLDPKKERFNFSMDIPVGTEWDCLRKKLDL